MKTYRFSSRINLGEKLPEFSEAEIKSEPQLFSADVGFASERGGPITRAFLAAVSRHGGVFDSRVSMMMPGWWACIPGYHHDDVPRETPDSQPDYDSPEYLSKHAMALVGADVCPTEFAIGDCELTKPHEGELIYNAWHREIVRLLDHGDLTRISCPDRTVVYFDWQTWHAGTPAVRRGWRWFGRLSWDTKRPVLNEIRTQTNVYVSTDGAAW